MQRTSLTWRPPQRAKQVSRLAAPACPGGSCAAAAARPSAAPGPPRLPSTRSTLSSPSSSWIAERPNSCVRKQAPIQPLLLQSPRVEDYPSKPRYLTHPELHSLPAASVAELWFGGRAAAASVEGLTEPWYP